jgi:branched-chain amino acid aminotransferase
MPLAKSEKIWMDGKFVNWDDATIHVCSHVVHYGTAVFEGMRCYKTPMGRGAFRLGPHVKRLFNSAKIYRMEIPFSEEQVSEAIIETIRVNKMEECYVRPIAYRGYNELGVNPFPNPVCVSVIVWKWGKYLGAEALDDGVDVCVSSWARIAPNTMPALAKCAANYMNSQLIKMEALMGGYVEGIALDHAGYVSEGSGENLFIVCEGKLITPPLGASVLPGITRDCVISRRGVLHGERRRDHSDSLDRQDQGRYRQARPRHQGAPGAFLRDPRGRGRGQVQVADDGLVRGRAS